MPYPDDDCEMTLAFAPGADLTADPDTWIFTDLSDRLVATPITVAQGVVIGAGTAKTGSATGIVCLNDDGWLTPFLATSPWWPYVDAGTPARLAVRTITTAYIQDSFGRTVASGWGTADNGVTWLNATGLSVSGGKGVISLGSTNLIIRARTVNAVRDIDAVFTVSCSAVVTGDRVFVGPQIRDDALGTTFLFPTLVFNQGGQIQLAILKVNAGVVTLTLAVNPPGLTYTAGTAVSCRIRMIGDRLQMRAWLASGSEQTTWSLDETVTGYSAAGAHINMAGYIPPGVTNTLPLTLSIDDITVQQPQYPRIEGYLTGVQPTFRQLPDGTTHSVVQISIGGIGSRLEKRQAADLSPLRRSLEKADTPPVEYWPLEDKSGATSAASAFGGHPAMQVTGPAVFAFDQGDTDDNLISSQGTAALCSLAAGAKLTATFTPSTSTSWTVSLVQQTLAPSSGVPTEIRIAEWATPGGTFSRWALVALVAGGYVVRGYNDTAGTTTNVATYASTFSAMLHLSVKGSQNGSNIDVAFLGNANTLATGSVAGTSTPVNRVTLNPDQANTTGSTDPFGIRFLVGHLTVHDALVTALPFYGDSTLGTTPRADRGWAYEAAHRRALRLADEEQVQLRVLGDPYTSGVTELNAQQPGSFVNLLKQAIDSESGGLLYEGEFGYVHDPRTNRYNRAVALTVDMTTYRHTGNINPEDVLVPKLDARGPNIWTVERNNGSANTAAADPTFLARRGEIRDQAVLDVLYDDDTAQHAAWRVHVNVDGQGANYPTTTVDLAANPDLIDDWLLCTIGSRLQRTNQPTIAGLGVIDQVIDGISETFTPRAAGGPGWTATCDTSPASVWDVGVYDETRWDSASTTLGSDVTDSDTVLEFSTTDVEDLWAFDDGSYQVEIAGQTNTVNWISLAGSILDIDGGMETGITGWVANGSSTLAASAAFAHTGAQSALLTVAGSPGQATMFNTTHFPVSASTAYTAYVWLYAPIAVNNVRMSISWYTSGAVFITSAVSSSVTISAGVWTQLTVSGTSLGTAALARPGPQITGSPANGTQLYVDDIDMVLDSAGASGSGPYVQQAWVTRDPDVTKALSAGEPIHLADAGVWGL